MSSTELVSASSNFLYITTSRDISCFDSVFSLNSLCGFPQAKILSQEYKALPEKEKKQWEDLAEKDKERYKREMEDYEPPSDDSDDDGKRRKKKKKDPNAPKRNQSAFFIYSNTHRSTVKEQNPEASFGDIAKIISKQFKALSEKERAKYDTLAAADKDRYKREMEAYKGT